MSGEGAFAVGGRWNSPGHHVVYASGNLSLAMLELLVHVDDAERSRDLAFVYHHIEVQTGAIATLAEGDVPDGWDSRPETRASQLAGDDWLKSRASVALAVPSVMTPARYRFALEYMNFLINPRHPEFSQVVGVGDVLDLELDPRLAS